MGIEKGTERSFFLYPENRDREQLLECAIFLIQKNISTRSNSMKINRIDNGGIKGYVKEVKLMTNVDWDDIFSKITDQETTICTYGDPDNQYNPFLENICHI